MTEREPSELERAVARAIAAPAFEHLNICGRVDLQDLFLPIARAAIAEVFRWRPIETAPKDGTPILLLLLEPVSHAALNWSEEPCPRKVSIGRWRVETWDNFAGWIVLEVAMGFSYGGETHSFEYADCKEVQPIGWMPLPPPQQDEP